MPHSQSDTDAEFRGDTRSRKPRPFRWKSSEVKDRVLGKLHIQEAGKWSTRRQRYNGQTGTRKRHVFLKVRGNTASKKEVAEGKRCLTMINYLGIEGYTRDGFLSR